MEKTKFCFGFAIPEGEVKDCSKNGRDVWLLEGKHLYFEEYRLLHVGEYLEEYNAYKMTPLCCYITGGSLQHTLQHHCRPPSASLSPAPSPGHPPPVQEAAGAAGAAGGNLDLWVRS